VTRRPTRKPASPRRIWIRRAFAVFAIIAAAIAIWFLIELFQPFHGAGHGSVEVMIPPDSSASQVGSILARDGVVDSGFFFKLRATIDGDRGKLLAGRRRMQLGMSYSAALAVLTKPPPSAPTTNVTIIPGRSRAQVDRLLNAAGIKGSYLRETKRSPLLDPTVYGAPRSTPSLEGFLFPDTYELLKPVQVKSLVNHQLTEFKKQFATVNFAYAKSKNLTEYDVLKIASLIEEESLTKQDGPLAASVIYNRLRLGMDLGLDSTVSYATGNYGSLTDKDLRSRSPWNTTNHIGLPPTPIDSPGLQAIEAAAHPAHTNYLYFINKVCGNGKLLFTASYNQFLTWSAAWNAATEHAAKHGGSAEFCSAKKK
jgi:UPF0755 protein